MRKWKVRELEEGLELGAEWMGDHRRALRFTPCNLENKEGFRTKQGCGLLLITFTASGDEPQTWEWGPVRRERPQGVPTQRADSPMNYPLCRHFIFCPALDTEVNE